MEPDVILFSASKGFENKIKFPFLNNSWIEKDVGANTPLLVGKFKINEKVTSILFQIQGRKPFLRTNKDPKKNFYSLLKLT
jgi:hypothetical protein